MNRTHWSVVSVIAICLLAVSTASQAVDDPTLDPANPPAEPTLEPSDPLAMDPMDDPLDDPLDPPTDPDPMGDPPQITSVTATLAGDVIVVDGAASGDAQSMFVEELGSFASVPAENDGSFSIELTELATHVYVQAVDINGASEIVAVPVN